MDNRFSRQRFAVEAVIRLDQADRRPFEPGDAALQHLDGFFGGRPAMMTLGWVKNSDLLWQWAEKGSRWSIPEGSEKVSRETFA